jgi:cell wall-associated NlpC family hydrolase
MTTWKTTTWAAMAVMASACGGQGLVESEELVGAAETGSDDSALSSTLPVGTKLRATANVNLRVGASTSQRVLLVVPNGAQVETVAGAPTNGFYNVKFNGTVGYSYGAYYVLAPAAAVAADPTARTAALQRARAGVGFSYFWGHGRLRPEGPTSSTAGACYGSCPNCSHNGSYGADCSGLVDKVWQLGANNTDLTVDNHPYGTWHFVNQQVQWKPIARSAVQPADAFVYNNGTSGHVFLYESGDAWGSVWAYECRGCNDGCVRNLRSASAEYRPISRDGY